MNNTIEQWRTINQYPNYQASNLGRVMHIIEYKILKLTILNNGYPSVQLYNDTEIKTVVVHRLVAQEFIDNSENKPFVDHIDRNKQNNCVNNLRWVSVRENSMNQNKKNNTTSIYKGVAFNKQRNKKSGLGFLFILTSFSKHYKARH